MEKHTAGKLDHPDPTVCLHHRQERNGLGADNRRNGHPAQGVGQRLLHRIERQRLYASGKPHPRIGPRGAGLRRKENAETVHQIVRQIHLRRDSRTACRSDAGTCACTGSRSGCDTDTGSESRTKKTSAKRRQTSDTQAPGTPEAAAGKKPLRLRDRLRVWLPLRSSLRLRLSPRCRTRLSPSRSSVR